LIILSSFAAVCVAAVSVTEPEIETERKQLFPEAFGSELPPLIEFEEEVLRSEIMPQFGGRFIMVDPTRHTFEPEQERITRQGCLRPEPDAIGEHAAYRPAEQGLVDTIGDGWKCKQVPHQTGIEKRKSRLDGDKCAAGILSL